MKDFKGDGQSIGRISWEGNVPLLRNEPTADVRDKCSWHWLFASE